jgi:hypothetical protein
MFNFVIVVCVPFSVFCLRVNVYGTAANGCQPNFGHIYIYIAYINASCGPGSSVGIATGYGLDGPGIESRWG